MNRAYLQVLSCLGTEEDRDQATCLLCLTCPATNLPGPDTFQFRPYLNHYTITSPVLRLPNQKTMSSSMHHVIDRKRAKPLRATFVQESKSKGIRAVTSIPPITSTVPGFPVHFVLSYAVREGNDRRRLTSVEYLQDKGSHTNGGNEASEGLSSTHARRG